MEHQPLEQVPSTHTCPNSQERQRSLPQQEKGADCLRSTLWPGEGQSPVASSHPLCLSVLFFFTSQAWKSSCAAAHARAVKRRRKKSKSFRSVPCVRARADWGKDTS